MSISKITELLGADAELLLNHTCKTISKENIHLPSGDFVDRLFIFTVTLKAKYFWNELKIYI